MSKVANQWIDLFRAGDYTVDGKGSFTDADLDQIVQNYDPVHYEAPSTIGHVKKNDKAPAYGWWSKLRRVGDLLQGQMGVVQPEFEEALERRLYKKRSVGLVKRATGWALHHVAWLGAQAPHIKALADLQFEDESETELIAIDFAQENDMAELTEETKKTIKQSVAEAFAAFVEKFQGKPAVEGEKTFSEADVTRIATEAAAAAVKPVQDELTAQKKNFSEREAKLVTNETSGRADAAIAKVKAGKAWVPAFDKAGLPAVFAELAKTTDATVEFGEGGNATKKTPLDTLADFLTSFGEIVPSGRKVDGVAADASTKPAVPANADLNSVAFSEAIKKRMAEKSLSYGEAMDQIAIEQPQLTKPGNSTAGSV